MLGKEVIINTLAQALPESGPELANYLFNWNTKHTVRGREHVLSCENCKSRLTRNENKTGYKHCYWASKSGLEMKNLPNCWMI